MPAAPAPAARGRCRTVPAGLGLSTDGAAVRSGLGAKKGLDGVGGQGLTYPFCCGALSAGRGAPKGRAVLLREALGAKVYRGGSAAGARAWAETEPGRDRAGRGWGLEWEWGAPPWKGQRQLQLRPHTSGRRLWGRGRLKFQGACLGVMISASRTKGGPSVGGRAAQAGRKEAGGQTGRHACAQTVRQPPGPLPILQTLPF